MAAWEYPLYHPKPGWAEQNPADWWASLGKASHAAIAAAGIRPEQVAGLCLDATCCSVVLCEQSGRPLRPAIIWMDVRSASQADRIGKVDSPALAYTGYGPVSAEWMPCKALWVKENEPEVWSRTEILCEYGDWMVHQLTGRWTTSLMQSSCRWFYNNRAGGFPRDLYGAVGLADAIDRFPADVLPTGTPVGGLTAEAAAHLGLRAGTPVMECGVDAYIAMPALQATGPGRLASIMGSSHCMMLLSAEEVHGSGIFGGYPDAVVPGYWMLEGGQTSTGSVVKWFRDQFGLADKLAGEAQGRSAYEVLSDTAAAIPPGSDGLLVLEHWQGSRTPNTDPLARGAVMGLSLRHTRAHLYRAIIEATAYGTAHILRSFAANGVEVNDIVACGGPTKSPFWMQIQADVCGRPILVPEVEEAPALGAAIYAAVGVGLYPNLEVAGKEMVRIARRVDPDPQAHQQYKPFVDAYIDAFSRVRPVNHTLARLQA